MSTENLFHQAFIYLLAAVVAVPVAKRLGLGSVLGYLIAGVLVGPFALRLVGRPGDVMHFAEFGVVMMLFLVGLELQPAVLWRQRGELLGLGGLQVVLTAAAVTLVALAARLDARTGLAAGLILAMSSTAIALQSLSEKGLLKTPGGAASFSVLLFQDLSVIPILAVLPLLAAGSGAAPAGAAGGAGTPTPAGEAAAGTAAAAAGAPGPDLAARVAALPAWERGLVVLAAVAAVVLAGRFLLRPVFGYIARTHLREMFTATALGLVVGIALLMQTVGLSAALGTFLAGVVLADNEYRHQLEADLEPFKGLLLGVFFIAVGAGIDFSFVARHPGLVAALVAGLLTVKAAVLLFLGRLFRLPASQGFLFAAALAQGGEFAFVLLSFGVQSRVLGPETANALVATVALSMAAAPLLLVANERLVQPRFARPGGGGGAARPADVIEEHDNEAVVAGFGRFGHVVGRLLRANGMRTVVLDHDPDQVETLRRFGLKSYYGDATRPDLLASAGAARARLFVVAIEDAERSLALVELVQREYPHLTIFARAVDREHAYRLRRRGVAHVYRETFGSALELGTDALRALGFRASHAHRAAHVFRVHDEASVRAMAALDPAGDLGTYSAAAREQISQIEAILQADARDLRPGADHGWDLTATPRAEERGEGEAEGKGQGSADGAAGR